MLSSVSFLFGISFKSLLHFRLILEKCNGLCLDSIFFFCMWMSNCSKTSLYGKDCFSAFAVWHCLSSFAKCQLSVHMGVYSLICFFVSFVHSFTHTIVSWLLQIHVDLKSCSAALQPWSFPLKLCCYSESFDYPYELGNRFVNIHKITRWDFDWNTEEFRDQFGKNWYVKNESIKMNMDYLFI